MDPAHDAIALVLSHLTFRQLKKYIAKHGLTDVDKIWRHKLHIEYPQYNRNVKSATWEMAYTERMLKQAEIYIQNLTSPQVGYCLYYGHDFEIFIEAFINKYSIEIQTDDAGFDTLKMNDDIYIFPSELSFTEQRIFNIPDEGIKMLDLYERAKILFRDVNIFLGQPMMYDNALSVYSNFIAKNKAGYINGAYILKLIDTIIDNTRGKFDEWLPVISLEYDYTNMCYSLVADNATFYCNKKDLDTYVSKYFQGTWNIRE